MKIGIVGAGQVGEAAGPEQRPLTLVGGFHRQGTFSLDR
jgi:hypothetical protein